MNVRSQPINFLGLDSTCISFLPHLFITINHLKLNNMKKQLLATCFVALIAILNVHAQTSTYFVSSNAHSLLDTYRDLVTQTNTQDCIYDNTGNPDANPPVKGNRHCTFSAMSAKGYNVGAPGFVSFASWYWFEHTNPITSNSFHSAWFSDTIEANAVLCRNTWPQPIVNPFKADVAIDNHVFEVILVPVSTYQSGYATTSLFVSGEDPANPFTSMLVKAADIQAINDVYLEAPTGYMNAYLSDKYNSSYSSVGIICEVVLKTGEKKACYIFNNYDDSGTLQWKNQNCCAITSNSTFSKATASSTLSKIDGKQAIGLRAYPNPANGIVTISGLQGKGMLRLLNATGKEVARKQVYSNVGTIEISNYTKGVYLVEYITNVGHQTIKIIKK
jgi:hypothetical protein